MSVNQSLKQAGPTTPPGECLRSGKRQTSLFITASACAVLSVLFSYIQSGKMNILTLSVALVPGIISFVSGVGEYKRNRIALLSIWFFGFTIMITSKSPYPGIIWTTLLPWISLPYKVWPGHSVWIYISGASLLTGIALRHILIPGTSVTAGVIPSWIWDSGYVYTCSTLFFITYVRPKRSYLPKSSLSPVITEPSSPTVISHDYVPEEKFQQLFHASPDGYFLTNNEGSLLDGNHALAKLFGRKQIEELIGKSVFDIHMIPPEQQPKALGQLENNLKGLPTGPDIFHFQGPTGSRKHIEISTFPITINENKVILGMARDISARQNAENRIAESEEKYRAMTENSTDIIVRFNQQLRPIYANPAFTGLTGMAPDVIIGRRADQLTYPHQIKDLVTRQAPIVFRTGSPMETQINYDWGTGEVFFHVQLIPEFNLENQAETVLLTARDITAFRRAQQRIHALSQELLKAQEQERQRIALDLHDNVAQDLASLKIACDTIFDQEPNLTTNTKNKFSRFSELLKAAISSVRDLAYNLRPPGLDQLGLVRTLARHCDDMTNEHGLWIDFQAFGLDDRRLGFDIEINLFRLFQEALNNIKNHADASWVQVRLVSSHPNLILRIEDNGTGFDVSKRTEESLSERHMGLQSMRERASLLNGSFVITSRPNAGTKIVVEVPLVQNTEKTN